MFPRVEQAQEIHIETIKIEVGRPDPIVEIASEPLPYRNTVLRAKVFEYAEYWGVDPMVMVDVINCENPEWNPYLQSRHKVPDGANGQEDSWGLAQWHLPAGNVKENGEVITYEDAINPDISLYEMARYFSQGKAYLWSCYGILKKSQDIS